ncbi:MAG: hypothetical protein E4H20_02305 [Spirochaetales bacterium]|nr:MAG: hypothetical protein E4H20_02305 [Spirochaetales bacterium]
MGILSIIGDFFRKLFGLDDGSARGELKRIYAPLSHLKPPYYRFKSNFVMQGLAADLYLFCQALKPLMDLADRTLAHPDLRVSRRFFDYLVDCELPPEELEKKDSFDYDGMKTRVENAVKGDEEIEGIGRDFLRFLESVELLAAGPLNTELEEVERFILICRHDWERLLGFFDPGLSLEDSRYHPDFQPVDGEQVLPEIIDAYYLTEGFLFSEMLLSKVMRVFERHAPAAAAGQRAKIEKMFSALNKILRYRMSNDNLLAVIRLCKRDPLYQPDLRREHVDFVDQYRRRIIVRFEKDRERLQRERHENAVAQDIKDLFGGTEVFSPEEYNDENDGFLRRESPNGFTYIKAMGILKTFTLGIFDQRIKETVKKVLVEGYFENKSYQNNLANILYQCDRTGGRIAAFEESLRGSGRVSVASVRRYVEEMRHGKDIMPFLTKIVDEINYKAREICEDETGLFQMLGEALGELLADYRKSSPELITNIRSLGGVRNREILATLADSKKRMETFVRIMRNFAFVKALPPAVDQDDLLAPSVIDTETGLPEDLPLY